MAPSLLASICFSNYLGGLFQSLWTKPPFSSLFQALGVTLNVSALHLGMVQLGNTESRSKKNIEFLDLVLSRGRMTKQEALRLRGRLQFTSGNVFARVGKCSLSAITNHAYLQRGTTLSQDALVAIRLHRHLLDDGRPRELKPASCEPWFIQTDASYDEVAGTVDAGIGAVLFNPQGKPVSYFSKKLPVELIEKLNEAAKQNAIFECEFFALYCAFLVWGERITNAVVIFTDNNGVRDSLISCSSRNATAKKLLVATMALECKLQLTPWYARVPTDSNMADGPSRYRCQKVIDLGAKEYPIDVLDSWSQLMALYEKWGEHQAIVQPQRLKV